MSAKSSVTWPEAIQSVGSDAVNTWGKVTIFETEWSLLPLVFITLFVAFMFVFIGNKSSPKSSGAIMTIKTPPSPWGNRFAYTLQHTSIVNGGVLYVPGRTATVSVWEQNFPQGIKLRSMDGAVLGQTDPNGPLMLTSPDEPEKHLYFTISDNTVFVSVPMSDQPITSYVNRVIYAAQDGSKEWLIANIGDHPNAPWFAPFNCETERLAAGP